MQRYTQIGTGMIVVAENLSIDPDSGRYATEGLRVAILARSGAGKSSLAALFVEGMLDSGHQVLVMETVAEWHTLKVLYPVIVAGGPYDDLPLHKDSIPHLMRLLERGVSMVINLSDIADESEQKSFAGDLLWNIYRRWQKVRRRVMVVLEESDFLAPQSWSRDDRASLSRVSMIAKHGRKLGIDLMLISQRPADLHKSPLSQCNVIFFGSFKSAQDLSASQGVMWLSRKLGISIREKEVTELKQGEFVAWASDGIARIQAYGRKTPHGGETPVFSFSPLPLPSDIAASLDSVRKEIEEIMQREQQEQDEVAGLRKKLQERDGAIRKLEGRIKMLEDENRALKAAREIPFIVTAPTQSGQDKKHHAGISESSPGIPEQLHEAGAEILSRARSRHAMRVYAFVAKERETSPPDICRSLGLSNRAVSKALRSLAYYKLVKIKRRHGRMVKIRIAS